MTRKANSLVKNILKEKNTSNNYIKFLNAFDKYFKSYKKSCKRSKSFNGADETDVRDQVWSFAREVSKSVDVSYEALNDLWNKRYNY